ncbi:sodium:galactoside symporter family protein [Burkholderia sp. H160]|nr:sodium:galactoside symporter family protein [Burkholderia sp. H160]
MHGPYAHALGRYKPWLVMGTPVVMVGTYFLMFAQRGVGARYLFGWLFMAYAGYSIVVLSLLALTAVQTRNYHERSLAFGRWQAAYTLGILCVVSLPMLMGPHAGNDRVTIMHLDY